MTAPARDDQIRALIEGKAFVDLASWWKTLVRGRDARTWLNDIVSTDVADLERGHAARSLLLSPTGRVRADFTIAATRDGFVLVQDPRQPSPVARLLEPYMLSSDVTLEDCTERFGLLAVLDGSTEPEGGERYEPSALGVGVDVVFGVADTSRARAATQGLVEADANAVEMWRILRGEARFGVDLTPDSLPHEAGLDATIGFGKGCFLGQEAVAKVRNLGHPPFVVLSFRAEAEVTPAEAIMASGEAVGVVTSAASVEGTDAAIGRVRWTARDVELLTAGGTRLRVTTRDSSAAS